jgi:hypothetical protein
LEYAPSTSEGFVPIFDYTENPEIILTENQEKDLLKAHKLFGFHAFSNGEKNMLNSKDLKNAIEAFTEEKISNAKVDILMSEFCGKSTYLSFSEFRKLVTCGKLFPVSTNRRWVVVSLLEAETIRKVLHVKRNASTALQEQSTEMALRFSPVSGTNSPFGDGGVIFDMSPGWRRATTTGATTNEAAVAHNSFRFFDCDMHFTTPALNVLVRILQGRYYMTALNTSCKICINSLCVVYSLRDRLRFFGSVISARRRLERKVKMYTVIHIQKNVLIIHLFVF